MWLHFDKRSHIRACGGRRGVIARCQLEQIDACLQHWAETQVLIDGQVYIDGLGAMSSFPKPVASLGIQVRLVD